jgi:hypothetical protein
MESARHGHQAIREDPRLALPPNRLMTGQPRHVDFNNPIQRKFVEKFPDELF